MPSNHIAKSKRYITDEGYTLTFYIYRTKKELQASIKDWHNAAGYKKFTLRFTLGYFRMRRKHAYIYLCLDNIGGGLVAHEIMHFVESIITLCHFHDLLIENNFERVADIMGDATNFFWTWFYDKFHIEEPKPNI